MLNKRLAFPSAVALLSVAGAIGCAGDADEDTCLGGKCDEVGDKQLESCFVSLAFGVPEIETAYKLTTDGGNLADAAKSRVSVTEDVDGNLTLHAGELTFTDVVRTDGVTDEDHEFRGYRVENAEGFDGPLDLRVFAENQVGMLARPFNGFQSPFAELDCNPGNAPHNSAIDPVCEGAFEDSNGVCRGPDGRFVTKRCCEQGAADPELAATDQSFACTVVTYDDSSIFDSAVGSPYPYTMEGEVLTEPGHWDVEFGTSSFSDRADGLEFDHGGLTIDDEGDTLEFLGDTEIESNGVTRTKKMWRFTREGASRGIEVSIFSDSGMGLMHHMFDDEPAVQMDCRATFTTPDELF